jgi:hypothetical protein
MGHRASAWGALLRRVLHGVCARWCVQERLHGRLLRGKTDPHCHLLCHPSCALNLLCAQETTKFYKDGRILDGPRAYYSTSEQIEGGRRSPRQLTVGKALV